MGLDKPDWAPLEDDEVRSVLGHYRSTLGALVSRARVAWLSPRPMSAGALVEVGQQSVFVKRHDLRVRDARRLGVEHALAAHVGGHDLVVAQALRTTAGTTTVTVAGNVYEVFAQLPGTDLYRDVMSWEPFRSLGHARSAGTSLATFHLAARSFPAPARPPGVLTTSCAIIASEDPLATVASLAAGRPGLGRFLASRDWQGDLTAHHLRPARAAARSLARLQSQWAHGDWHPSNLSWSSRSPSARVAGVFDLGLANRTYAVHDVAIALERSTVGWLGLTAQGSAAADLDAVDALLDGYEHVRPLTRTEAICLPDVLAVSHLEYALSEVEYFAEVVKRHDNAALAYDAYLVGHARWFQGPEGALLVEHLGRRARSRGGVGG